MSAYVIANVRFANSDSAQEYGRQVAGTVETYGGRYLARGGRAEVTEGEGQPGYMTVLEFASLDQAKRWYESDEYRGLRSLRRENAQSEVTFVEGLASGSTPAAGTGATAPGTAVTG